MRQHRLDQRLFGLDRLALGEVERLDEPGLPVDHHGLGLDLLERDQQHQRDGLDHRHRSGHARDDRRGARVGQQRSAGRDAKQSRLETSGRRKHLAQHPVSPAMIEAIKCRVGDDHSRGPARRGSPACTEGGQGVQK